MNCYICNFTTDIHRVVSGFTVHTCKKCGLKWVSGVTKNDILSFYNEGYFDSNSKLGYRDYLTSEKIHRKNAKRILRIVDKIRFLNGTRILDIGCAFGFLLDEAEKFKKCNAYGVELSHYAYEYAKNILGLNVLNCEFESANFEPEFFDVVFLIGTIEHIMSPRDIIKVISKILKPRGLLVMTTIDMSCLFPLYSFKLPEHLFYFNYTNMSLLLKETGFKIIFKKTHFPSYYYLHEAFYRLGNILSLPFSNAISKIIKEKMPKMYVKIPTNEMILVAQKDI